MQNDLTTGSVFRNVVSFSLPYLLSYFLQTLYGMADLFIIGQFEGVASTTAVSIGSQVMHMLTVMLVGLAMGATVSIAQAAGGGDKKRTASAIGNTVTLFMLLSLALTALLLALRGGIVSIMSTPEEAVQGTLAYLTVCFIGIPFITAYNIIASIFRGLGDSKRPMYFIAAACVVNIGLDFFFMGALRLGPAGAALGTTLSQAVSVLLALCVILKRRSIRLSKSDFCPRKATMKDILSIGLPVAAQDGFIQVSFMLITIMANQRGLTDAAAVGIVEKIISFLFLVPSSMLSTVSALGAQNIGAGKYDRIKQGTYACMFIGILYCVLFVLIAQFGTRYLALLFMNADEAASVMSYTQQLNVAYAYATPLLLGVNVLRLSIQGMGYSRLSLISGLLEMLARTVVSLWAVPAFGFDAACLASPFAWLLADCFLIPAFYGCLNARRRQAARVRQELPSE